MSSPMPARPATSPRRSFISSSGSAPNRSIRSHILLHRSDRGTMQNEDELIAARYRDHAEALRTASSDALDSHTRTALAQLAEEYERLARTRDLIARSIETLRRIHSNCD